MNIDAHHHIWHPARGDYGWMPADDPILTRQYSPVDLQTGMNACEIRGTVLVQAAPTVNETEYLLGIADATPHVLAVVGWIDFESGSSETLERLAQHPRFAGVRPMIQDLPDPDWMLREDIQWAFQCLIDQDLSFDALGYPQHINNFTTLFSRYPTLRTVLDHCLKPEIRNHTDKNFETWATAMSRLARETSVYCKLSGLLTEDGESWSIENLRPYVDHILTEFTPQRVMWGSDWPVVRLRCEYEQWFEMATSLTVGLNSSESKAVFGKNAVEFYQLDITQLV